MEKTPLAKQRSNSFEFLIVQKSVKSIPGCRQFYLPGLLDPLCPARCEVSWSDASLAACFLSKEALMLPPPPPSLAAAAAAAATCCG